MSPLFNLQAAREEQSRRPELPETETGPGRPAAERPHESQVGIGALLRILGKSGHRLFQKTHF